MFWFLTGIPTASSSAPPYCPIPPPSDSTTGPTLLPWITRESQRMRSPDLVFLIENFHKVSAGFHFIVKKFFFKFYFKSSWRNNEAAGWYSRLQTFHFTLWLFSRVSPEQYAVQGSDQFWRLDWPDGGEYLLYPRMSSYEPESRLLARSTGLSFPVLSEWKSNNTRTVWRAIRDFPYIYLNIMNYGPGTPLCLVFSKVLVETEISM